LRTSKAVRHINKTIKTNMAIHVTKQINRAPKDLEYRVNENSYRDTKLYFVTH